MIERAFRSLLLADPVVAGLVGDRVLYGVMEQRATFPRVQITKVSKTSGLLLSDTVGMNAVRVQVDCWARSIDEVRALADAVNGADDQSTRGPLHGRSTVGMKLIELLVERAAEYEPDESPDRQLYRVSADYLAHL